MDKIVVTEIKMIQKNATGTVTKAHGNLIQVRFDGHIRQGEVAFVCLPDVKLKAEVLEIMGQEARLQVFEDTKGVECGTPVEFCYELLEAELGPGLLTSIFDGLQNPLEEVSKQAGFYLPRGIYLPPIDRKRKWEFTPTVSLGTKVKRGSFLGFTQEGRFKHQIMVPFSLYGRYKVIWHAEAGSFNVEEVIAKLEDEKGVVHDVRMLQKWPIKMSLREGERVLATEMMDTGCRVVDTQFPILKGATFCTPGPFGAGKTVLQHHLSKYSSVDIVVVAACGERAGEVVEVLREFPHLIDPHTNGPLINRTVIICNTSSMPVAARESSIYMGVTIAEYYRQMGLDVLLLADSTSRWAQALREMSGRLEEIPGDEAFPAYLASRIAEFYQRSGVIRLNDGSHGSVTIGGAVSPAGGNFEEPVTQATLAVVNTFLGLSRARSDSRRYPAIDPLISWTKTLDAVAKDLKVKAPDWKRGVLLAQRLLKEGDEISKRMEVVGEEGTPIDDLVLYLKAELYDNSYLQQNAFDKEDAYCPLERQIVTFNLLMQVFDKAYHFKSHDEAHRYFIALQNQLKNINYLAFNSEEYRHSCEKVTALINKSYELQVGSSK